MTDDIDIYRTANVLVELHGEDAPIQAITHFTGSARWIMSGQ